MTCSGDWGHKHSRSHPLQSPPSWGMAAEDTGLSPCCRHPKPPAPGAPTTHQTLLASQPSPGTRLPAGRGCLHPTGPCVPKAVCSPEGGRRAVLREPCGVHHPQIPSPSKARAALAGHSDRCARHWMSLPATRPRRAHAARGQLLRQGWTLPMGTARHSRGTRKHQPKEVGASRRNGGAGGAAAPLALHPKGGQAVVVVFIPKPWSWGGWEVCCRAAPLAECPSTRVGRAVKQPEPPFPSVVGRAGTHYTTSVPLPSPPAPRTVPPAAGSQRDWGTIAPRSQPLPTAKQELPMSQWSFKPAAVPSSPG